MKDRFLEGYNNRECNRVFMVDRNLMMDCYKGRGYYIIVGILDNDYKGWSNVRFVYKYFWYVL